MVYFSSVICLEKYFSCSRNLPKTSYYKIILGYFFSSNPKEFEYYRSEHVIYLKYIVVLSVM